METKTYERQYKRFIPTEISDQILIELSKYRYLSSEFLRELVDCSRGYLKRRLQHMRHDYKLIYEPPDERANYHDYRYAYNVYGLDEAGQAYLEENGLVPDIVAQVHRRKPNKANGEDSFKQVKIRNYDHAQMIITTLASIEIACRREGLEFIPWGKIKKQHKSEKHKKMPFKLKGMRQGKFIIPDGIFGIRYPNGKVSYFALEAENQDTNVRGDVNDNCFKRKVLAYRQAIRENEYHKEILGISNLRVLVVCGNATKLQNEIEVVREEYGQSNLFLFAHIPERKELGRYIKPFPEILTTPCLRAGMSPKALYDKE